jgi:hypothetical protein
LAKDLLRQVKPLIGSRFLVDMNDRGEILAVDVPEQSMEAIRSAPVSMQIRTLLTPDGLKQLFGQSAIVFPEQELSTGEQWSTHDEIATAIGRVTRTNRFTYNGPSTTDGNSRHVFVLETEILPQEPNGTATIEDQKSSGTISFSSTSDTLLTSSNDFAMTLSRTHREMKIVTSVNTSVRMQIKRKK